MKMTPLVSDNNKMQYSQYYLNRTIKFLGNKYVFYVTMEWSLR